MRKLLGWQDKAIGVWLVALSLFQLYTGVVGILQPRIQRGVHLLFLLPAAFILFPATRKSSNSKIGIIDICLAFLATLPPLYVIIFHEALTVRLEFVDPVSLVEVVLGLLMIVLMVEAVRRAVARPMAALIAAALLYLFVAPYLPGIFHAKAVGIGELVETQYLFTDTGIFGMITGVSATFVALFVIFGAFMECTSTGRFFTDLACRQEQGRARQDSGDQQWAVWIHQRCCGSECILHRRLYDSFNEKNRLPEKVCRSR
jgi:TRAP-type uncharacterized transport system fused permease subunit